MSQSSLAPHGQYALEKQGPVIVMSARGPWNREAVAQYRQELAALTLELCDQPWGLLGRLQGEALLLPEAAALLREGTASDTPRGRVATALVLDNVLLADLVEEQFRSVYAGQPQAVRFFSDEDEARRWLAVELECARRETFGAIA